jgi:hypothetical protein
MANQAFRGGENASFAMINNAGGLRAEAGHKSQ